MACKFLGPSPFSNMSSIRLATNSFLSTGNKKSNPKFAPSNIPVLIIPEYIADTLTSESPALQSNYRDLCRNLGEGSDYIINNGIYLVAISCRILSYKMCIPALLAQYEASVHINNDIKEV